MKRSPMPARAAPMRRGAPIGTPAPKRTGDGKRQPNPATATSISAAVRAEVTLRDGGCVVTRLSRPAEWDGPHPLDVRCHGRIEAHHLWRAGQGGPGQPWNLKMLCSTHHAWVHGHVEVARRLDLLRRAGEVPPGAIKPD